MTTATFCGACGAPVATEARFCVRCGTRQKPIEDLVPTSANGSNGSSAGQPDADTCPACGIWVVPGQRACRSCGIALADPEDPWIGATLAHYRIERVIARGGMGVVYHAFDERLERSVALKLLREDLTADEKFRRRFVDESHAAAALDHPNILPVFDAGQTEGILYLATRLVDGLDLRRLLAREGMLPVQRALGIASQVGAALDLAHSRGLVHRDVKPANILLVPRENRGDDHAYLIDFGISKRENADVAHTGTGEFIGTAAYAAPEQIGGARVDGRTDQYALACVLYECLTGGPPFRGESTVDMLHAHLHEPAPRPSDARGGTPESLDAAVMRALDKNPARRFDTCRGFIAVAQAGREPAAPRPRPAPTRQPAPTLVAPMPMSPPAARAPRRGWLGGAAILVAALVLAGGAVTAALLLRSRSHAEGAHTTTQRSAGSLRKQATPPVDKPTTRVVSQQTVAPLDVPSIPTNTRSLNGYTIDLPDWTLVKDDEPQPSPEGITRRRTQVVDPQRNVGVIVDHLTGFDTTPYDNRTKLDRMYARAKPGYRRLAFTDYQLGNRHVYEWRFRYDDNGAEARRVDLLFNDGADSFGVEGTGNASYDDLAALARASAESVVVDSPQG
jgi:hypothetical protein